MNDVQRRGIRIYGLSHHDVHTINYGEHTLTLMLVLFKRAIENKNFTFTFNDAFQIAKELNEIQAKGIKDFELTRDQVLTKNFGKHTLDAIIRLLPSVRRQPLFIYGDLSANDRAANAQEAFNLVKELNPIQIEGILRHGLTRKHVLNDIYNEQFLGIVRTLHAQNPAAKGEHLYEIVSNLAEYELRGILNNNLPLNKLGFCKHLIEGKFEKQSNENNPLSAAIVDAHYHLTSVENIDSNKAFDIALTLNSKQIIGMIDFGLSLQQVQNVCFINTEDIIEKIAKVYEETYGEFTIPLVDECERKQFGEVFNNMANPFKRKQGIKNTEAAPQNPKKNIATATTIAYTLESAYVTPQNSPPKKRPRLHDTKPAAERTKKRKKIS